MLQFWHLWNTQRCFFGFLMRCGYADCSWDFWVLDFGIYVSEICHFLCSSLMRLFVVNIFSFFRSVWLVKKSWCVHCCSNHRFYWLSDRCRSGFALWWSFSERSCRHSAGSFSFFLVLTLLEFHKIERHSCFFGLIVHFSLVKRTWECLVFNFSFFCGIVSFYVPISDAVFLVTTFPFLIRVSGWYYLFDVLILFHLFNFTGVVVVALANLRWSVFVSKKISQFGSFH